MVCAKVYHKYCVCVCLCVCGTGDGVYRQKCAFIGASSCGHSPLYDRYLCNKQGCARIIKCITVFSITIRVPASLFCFTVHGSF